MFIPSQQQGKKRKKKTGRCHVEDIRFKEIHGCVRGEYIDLKLA